MTACGVTGVAGGCGDRLPRPSRFSRDGDLPSSVGSVGDRLGLRSSLWSLGWLWFAPMANRVARSYREKEWLLKVCSNPTRVPVWYKCCWLGVSSRLICSACCDFTINVARTSQCDALSNFSPSSAVTHMRTLRLTRLMRHQRVSSLCCISTDHASRRQSAAQDGVSGLPNMNVPWRSPMLVRWMFF